MGVVFGIQNGLAQIPELYVHDTDAKIMWLAWKSSYFHRCWTGLKYDCTYRLAE
jgi:hypothetical protein